MKFIQELLDLIPARRLAFGFSANFRLGDGSKKKSYNVATLTAELRRVEPFAGLLTSKCCDIFICNTINEIF
jgi:hypothetical protein